MGNMVFEPKLVIEGETESGRIEVEHVREDGTLVSIGITQGVGAWEASSVFLDVENAKRVLRVLEEFVAQAAEEEGSK